MFGPGGSFFGGGECGIGAALDACGWDWCCGGGFVEGLCKI